MKMGFVVPDETLHKLGYNLLSRLFASYDFDLLHREGGIDVLERDPDLLDIYNGFCDDYFSEDILTLASLSRALDDQEETLTCADKVLENGIGKIFVGVGEKKLTLREGCNKIIHGNVVKLEYLHTETHPIWGGYYRKNNIYRKGNYKNPILKIDGNYMKEKWHAEINLISYIIGTSIRDLTSWRL